MIAEVAAGETALNTLTRVYDVENTIEEKTHSKIGASSAERFWHCPGSVTVYGHLENKSSFYAAEGTAAHRVAEICLKEAIRSDTLPHESQPSIMKNAIIEVDGFNIKVEDGIIDAVGEYLTFLAKELEKYNSPLYRLKVEVEFHLKHLNKEAYGTCDALIHVPYSRLIVVDYKHGAGVPVDVEDNKQLKYYALGAYYALPKDEAEEIYDIEMVIVQPRCVHADGGIRRTTIAVKELLKWEKELQKAVDRVENKDETLLAGKHCKFCRAKAICPEAKNEVARLAGVDFEKVDFTTIDIKTISPKEIAHLMQYVPFIKDWCDEILKHAHTEAERGITIPGYKLVEKRANRIWKDPEKVKEKLYIHYKEEIYEEPKLLSPAKMEKMVDKKDKEFLETLWLKPDAGKTLVKENDKRKEKLPTIIEDFIDIEI